MTYRNTDFRQIGESLLKVIGKTLCSASDCVDVHSVSTGTHDAAKAARTEFELTIEAFDKFRLIVGVKHTLHLGARFGIIFGRQPLFCGFCHLCK